MPRVLLQAAIRRWTDLALDAPHVFRSWFSNASRKDKVLAAFAAPPLIALATGLLCACLILAAALAQFVLVPAVFCVAMAGYGLALLTGTASLIAACICCVSIVVFTTLFLFVGMPIISWHFFFRPERTKRLFVVALVSFKKSYKNAMDNAQAQSDVRATTERCRDRTE